MTSSLNAPQLKSIYIRHENADTSFRACLVSFLSLFKGLENSHVLLEGGALPQGLGSVVKAHCETLKTFVWDQRIGPRAFLESSVASVSSNLDHLKIISKHCRALVGLGIMINWKEVTTLKTRSEEVNSLLLFNSSLLAYSA